MRARQTPEEARGGSNALYGRPIGQEYDGLESGELAWILGKKVLGTTLDAMGGSAHALGMGYGPDRMQRLAYTSWVEAHFQAQHGSKAIRLDSLSLAGAAQRGDSKEIDQYAPFLKGASVLGSVDLPHVVNATFGVGQQLSTTGEFDELSNPGPNNPPAVAATPERGDAARNGLSSGLLAISAGPFLRGKIVDDRPVEMLAPTLLTPNGGNKVFHTVPRNLGDRLAFEALFAEMRKNGMFEWTPDGMILSKLESPSGQPLSSAELDARQAQLFNVCVQGPAIAKTWTGDPRMQCMPLDKVFVVIVADISSTTGGATAGIGAGSLTAQWDAYKGALADKQNFEPSANDPEPKPAGPYTTARKSLSKGEDGAQADVDAFFGDVTVKQLDDASAASKLGKSGFSNAEITNFRLMRVTSSFLSLASAPTDNGKAIDPKSRCGLRIGKKGSTYTGEYIIGGWCIGSVVDSAASRSSVGNQVRTAPASMAINVNVNVEFWTGDDLHRAYCDVNKTVLQRGQQSANPAREVNADVALADLEERVSWFSFSERKAEAPAAPEAAAEEAL
jgi:hypothetical protein